MIDYNRGDAVVLAGLMLAIFVLIIYVFIMITRSMREFMIKNPVTFKELMLSVPGFHVAFLMGIVTILFILSGTELYLYITHVLG